MTSPFESDNNRAGDVDNVAPDRLYSDTDRRNEELHDSARDTSAQERGVQRDGSADTRLRDERSLGDEKVVKTEPVPVEGQCCGGHHEHREREDLGLKDANAGQGCTCGNHGEGCTCGHHESCDCPPGECHCQGHAGAHRNEGGVPDHGDCECQQCEDRRREDRDEKDFTNPDTVNPDGTNPSVTTVEKAETYNEGAGWNDGIEPAESENPQQYENDDKNVN